jgi:hypothetical protein
MADARCYSIYNNCVRLAAWVTIAFAVLSAAAVFLPGVELQVGGLSLGRRTSLSLYQAAKERDFARALLGKYQAIGSRHVGERAADLLLEHAAKHAKKAHVDDARDAMSTLDDVSESDVRTAGRALVGLTWGYLGLVALLVALLFSETMRGEYSRKRTIAAVVLATLAAALAVAVMIGWREAVWQANDELGIESFGLGIGAYLMPFAACGAMAAAIALLVQHVRAARQQQ